MVDLIHGDDLSEDGVINDRSLIERLVVVRTQGDDFNGWPPHGFRGRLFGGHLLAQAILAGAGTVDENRTVNSVHVYFLAAGRQGAELLYQVERVRDGGSFSIRAVRAVQDGRVVMHASMSFVREHSGGAQVSVAMPEVPGPEELMPLHERRLDGRAAPEGFNWPARRAWWTASRPLDIRYVDDPELPDPSLRCFWFRAAPATGASQNQQRAILAFASDRSLLPAVTKARRGKLERSGGHVASVDHALWFHDHVTAGEWYLYSQESPFSTAGLGTARGLIFNRGGTVAATVTQQGVFSLLGAADGRPDPQHQNNGKD